MSAVLQSPQFRFQFRLRTVFVVVTVFCGIAWIASHFRSIPADEEKTPARNVPPPAGVTLRASVDSRTYRVGDPIRLELELKNDSTSVYALVMPEMPSPWYPTMAFGVRLTRGNQVIWNSKPSDFYVGSYSGPPPFKSFGPGAVFHSKVCLQHFVGDTSPLPEGDYQLDLAFDSAAFAMIQPKGSEFACRFDAKPVAFSIRGGARTDPEEILNLIGDKVGLQSIVDDITSSDPERRPRAWFAIWAYGDSRLSPFLRKYFPAPDMGPGVLELLYPFKSRSRR
jgi:hypothetical protein